MEARKLRGAEIAKAGGIRNPTPKLWIVPSQSHLGKWVVDYTDGEPNCTCPDYSKRARFCKHIFAIEMLQHRVAMPTQAQREQVRYVTDWSSYNEARKNEKGYVLGLLHALCQGIEEPRRKGRGRPPVPLTDMVHACGIKVFSGTAGRQATYDLDERFRRGLLSRRIHYNTISDYMKKPELTPLLRTLLQESSSPMAALELDRNFAVDSTGFGTQTYHRYYEKKHGTKADKRKKRDFIKAHAICGTGSCICTDLIISDRHDATQLRELVDQTAKRFEMDTVCADKAYGSKKNFEAIDRHGAVPYIPFKKNIKAVRGPKIWRKMFHYVQINEDEFKKHYHKRSNVETMFSMIEARFGKYVRSKDPVAQANEVYLQFLLHNFTVLVTAIHQFGLTVEFFTEDGMRMGAR